MLIGRAEGPDSERALVGSLPPVIGVLGAALETGLRSELGSQLRSSNTLGFLAASDEEALQLLSAFAVSRGGHAQGQECSRVIAEALRDRSNSVLCELPYEAACKTAFFPACHSILINRLGGVGVQVVLGSGEMNERACTHEMFARRLSVRETCSFSLLPIPQSRGAVCVNPREIAAAVREAGIPGYAVQVEAGTVARLSMESNSDLRFSASFRAFCPSTAKIVEANGAFAIEGVAMDLLPEFRSRLVVQVCSALVGGVAGGEISNLKERSAALVSAATALITTLVGVERKGK